MNVIVILKKELKTKNLNEQQACESLLTYKLWAPLFFKGFAAFGII